MISLSFLLTVIIQSRSRTRALTHTHTHAHFLPRLATDPTIATDG